MVAIVFGLGVLINHMAAKSVSQTAWNASSPLTDSMQKQYTSHKTHEIGVVLS
tara:strand:- start:310 stop:468 length:159 start_codon:yes stop_codon:yes gene_type:complete